MGRWDDQITQTGIRNSLDELGRALDAGDYTPDMAETVDRIRHFTTYVSMVLESGDARLTSQGVIAQMVAPLNQAAAEIRLYHGDANGGHLDNASAQLDSILPYLAQLPTAPANAMLSAALGEVSRVEEAARRLRDDISTVSTTASQRLDVIDAEAIGRDAAMRERVDAFAGRVDELAGTIEVQKARLDEAITAFQGQFSTAQDARSQEFASLRDALTNDASQLRAQLEQQNVGVQSQLQLQAGDLIDAIRTLHEQAAKVTEAIGIEGRAAGYHLDAESQKTAADKLRIAAMGALVLTAAATIWAATVAGGSGNFNWGRFLARSLAATAIASIAAYLIVQSAHHRERERRARKLELELASIDPYLALMPPDAVVEVKKKLADAWFGQPLEAINEAGGAHAASIPVAELVQILMRFGSKGG